MRKIILGIVMGIMIVALTACGATAPAESVPATDEGTAAQAMPGSASDKPVMPESASDVVSAMLENPQELFREGRDEMAENKGGNFGSGVAEKRVNEERMELFAGDNNAYLPLNTRLRDFGGDNRPQQAVLVKFQPENVRNLYFTFVGMSEFSISFAQDNLYFVDVQAFAKEAFADRLPNSFNLKWDAVYYLLVAFDDQANLRCLIWEENAYRNQAYFEKSLYNGADDIYESNWQMAVGFDGGGQLNLYEYAVYTFDKLTENPPLFR